MNQSPNVLLIALRLAHQQIREGLHVTMSHLSQLFKAIAFVVSFVLLFIGGIYSLVASAEYFGIDLASFTGLLFVIGWILTIFFVGLYSVKTYINYKNIARQLDH